MATVVNKGEPFDPIDPALTKHNRVTATAPNAALMPLFSGEIVLDTTSKQLWQAQRAGFNDSWVPYQIGNAID